MKPFDIQKVRSIARSVLSEIRESADEQQPSDETPQTPVYSSDIDLIGRSDAFVEVMKLVGRVASTNLPVVITGESGTGKEVVARAIHRRSPRAQKPFVAVNCGAIPSELIESELFGHLRGAFTGASFDRRGLWEEADGGTVFLDEITETTPAFQVKLLRALQEGEIRRVGSNQTVRVNVRVITATNRDIEDEVRAGRFRQDLLYRLNVVTIQLPPLRERVEDILPLAERFAVRAARAGEPPVKFSPEALRLMERYSWPGNIRELENTVARAAALSERTIFPDSLPERVRSFSEAEVDGTKSRSAETEEELVTLAESERRHVARVLSHTGGNKRAAARILDIDRNTLQRMIKRYNLDADEAADDSRGESNE